ncbi:hypothetical protein [Mesorhizobium sp. M1406]|uniref:hypothetical protein n=1 Tax=Mesorhizobium sp. M1406 TaxID=2957099 RepID=UPI003338CAEF
MTVIQLKESYIKSMKRELRGQCSAGSVHLTEAIARACGYSTNAALLADLNGQAEGRYLRFDEDAFRMRLLDFNGTAPEKIELPELGRLARYVESLFDDTALGIIEMHPMRARFRLGGIDTVVQIDLVQIGNGNVQFRRSHAIHTPTQAGPYWPGRDFDDDPAYAMHRAIESIVDYYRQAIGEGYRPDPKWLVKSRY